MKPQTPQAPNPIFQVAPNWSTLDPIGPHEGVAPEHSSKSVIAEGTSNAAEAGSEAVSTASNTVAPQQPSVLPGSGRNWFQKRKRMSFGLDPESLPLPIPTHQMPGFPNIAFFSSMVPDCFWVARGAIVRDIKHNTTQHDTSC